MAHIDVENALVLIKAQTHEANQAFLYHVDSMCLKCAIELGLFEVMLKHVQPMTLLELVAALPKISPSKVSCLNRLMRVLVHSKFITIVDVGQVNDTNEEEEIIMYSVTTPAAATLLQAKGEAYKVPPHLLSVLPAAFLAPWNFLASWFEDDNVAIATAFVMAHGMSFYDKIACDPLLENFFYETMRVDSEAIAGAMIRDCKDVFLKLTSLVDVGGADGIVAKAICNEFPNLKCTVFDLPHVVANLQGSENVQYVGGDMFEAIPRSDAILLKWILHNWNDEDCTKILKRCKEAIPSHEKGGKVVVIDISMKKLKNGDGDDQSLYRAQMAFDMTMMVLLNGKERTEKEWKRIFVAAGFTGGYKIHDASLGVTTLIEVYP